LFNNVQKRYEKCKPENVSRQKCLDKIKSRQKYRQNNFLPKLQTQKKLDKRKIIDKTISGQKSSRKKV